MGSGSSHGARCTTTRSTSSRRCICAAGPVGHGEWCTLRIHARVRAQSSAVVNSPCARSSSSAVPRVRRTGARRRRCLGCAAERPSGSVSVARDQDHGRPHPLSLLKMIFNSVFATVPLQATLSKTIFNKRYDREDQCLLIAKSPAGHRDSVTRCRIHIAEPGGAGHPTSSSRRTTCRRRAAGFR